MRYQCVLPGCTRSDAAEVLSGAFPCRLSENFVHRGCQKVCFACQLNAGLRVIKGGRAELLEPACTFPSQGKSRERLNVKAHVQPEGGRNMLHRTTIADSSRLERQVQEWPLGTGTLLFF